jgi:hypothetical protein
MKLALAFLLGAVTMVCIQGRSEESKRWFVVSGVAHHLDGGGYCNNRITKGLGIEIDGWAIGGYDNSNCNLSFYAAKYWLPLRFENWRLGAFAGAVSGYGPAVLPAAGLALTYEGKKWGANLSLIPPAGDSSGVLWGQLKFRW